MLYRSIKYARAFLYAKCAACYEQCFREPARKKDPFEGVSKGLGACLTQRAVIEKSMHYLVHFSSRSFGTLGCKLKSAFEQEGLRIVCK